MLKNNNKLNKDQTILLALFVVVFFLFLKILINFFINDSLRSHWTCHVFSLFSYVCKHIRHCYVIYVHWNGIKRETVVIDRQSIFIIKHFARQFTTFASRKTIDTYPRGLKIKKLHKRLVLRPFI